MQGITKNEAKTINYLIRNFRDKNSINELGRKLGMSPMGIHKILKNLETQKMVISEKIGNSKIYKISLNSENNIKLAEFVLSQNNLNKYASIQADDLECLKQVTKCCILFGSVISKGNEARDIDVLIIIEKKDFNKVNELLNEIKTNKTKNIHEVLQTKEDLIKNLKEGDKVIVDIIKTGAILWGTDIIAKTISEV